ncbi:YeiH family protein [Undibacterium sp. Jales W-56]|uniref:YeiH family protein n=1 Tax=Undibacterium sp. Jales W-56 TaxID=2897325 RepID=UPI0021CF5735|nr:YeiH family protein [Undibacterium sp. Jales W-56]MCU6435144.1 YeiH family protein [Undibacterium sp. Jales W-56]
MPGLAPASATSVTQHVVNEWKSVLTYLPGMLLVIIIASIAIWLGRFSWLAGHGLGALSLAIFLGIVAGNTAVVSGAAQITPGIRFSKQHLLRLGIVLYGFRLNFQDLAQVGISGFLTDALVLISTFSLSVFIGVKLFKLDRSTAILIGAGSSICGAAAIMATENVVNAKSEEVSVAISTVVLFGTTATFLYPLLYHWNLSCHLVPAGADFFGVFIGSTIHDVAQVVAVAHAIGEQVERTAIVAKMGRVMMLAPFLIFLSLAISKKRAQEEQFEAAGNSRTQQQAISVPWFALIFVLMVAINSMLPLSKNALNLIRQIDACLLAMAMVALGLSTDLSAIRSAGAKPLLLGGVIFVWLMAGGLMINQMMA